MRDRLGASGAEKLCAHGAIRASVRPLNFTVRRHDSSLDLRRFPCLPRCRGRRTIWL